MPIRKRRLASFWGSAERLDCWNLADWSDRATDLVLYRIFLRRGDKVRRLDCYGFLSNPPQKKLVDKIEALGDLDQLPGEGRAAPCKPGRLTYACG